MYRNDCRLLICDLGEWIFERDDPRRVRDQAVADLAVKGERLADPGVGLQLLQPGQGSRRQVFRHKGLPALLCVKCLQYGFLVFKEKKPVDPGKKSDNDWGWFRSILLLEGVAILQDQVHGGHNINFSLIGSKAKRGLNKHLENQIEDLHWFFAFFRQLEVENSNRVVP